MKRSPAFVVVLSIILLSLACSPKMAPTPNQTATGTLQSGTGSNSTGQSSATNQTATGTLQGVTSPNSTGQASVTLQTPQGNTMTLPVTSNTAIALDGQVCTIDQLAAFQAANVSFNCTSVWYMDENGQTVTVAVNVTKIVP